MIIVANFCVSFVISFLTDYRFCQNNVERLNPKYVGPSEGVGGQEVVFE